MPQCLRGTRDTGMATVTRTKLGSVATHIAVTTHIVFSTRVECINPLSNSAPEGCCYPSIFPSVELTDPTRPPKDAITLQSFPLWSLQSQREGFRLRSERAKRCLPVIHLGKDHFWKLKKPRKERKEGGKGKKNPSCDARLFVLWTES